MPEHARRANETTAVDNDDDDDSDEDDNNGDNDTFHGADKLVRSQSQ